MLRLKAARSLNCSAGGVLYHYTNNYWKGLEEYVTKGIPASSEPWNKPPFDVPFISFSRTKTSPPLFSIRGDACSWYFGGVYSKDRLSNIGKIKPFHHGGQFVKNIALQSGLFRDDLTDSTEMPVKIEVGDNYKSIRDPKDRLNWIMDSILPNSALASIRIGNTNLPIPVSIDTTPAEVRAFVKWTANRPNLVTEVKAKEPHSNGEKYQNAPDRNVPDTHVLNVVSTGTASLQDLLSVPVEAIRYSVKKLLEQREGKSKIPEDIVLVRVPQIGADYHESDWVPFRLDESRREELFRFLEECKSDPNIQFGYSNSKPDMIEISSDKGLPVGESGFISSITSWSRYNESEDRLLLPEYQPGETVSETVKALIGVIIPKERYYTDKAVRFRKAHPNLQMYVWSDSGNPVYDEKLVSEAGIDPELLEKPVPREAFQNPVA